MRIPSSDGPETKDSAAERRIPIRHRVWHDVDKGHKALVMGGLPMRAWMTRVFLLLGACLWLSGAAQAQQPVRGGILEFGIHAGDPPTYDCHASSVFSIIHLLSPHYSSLLKIDTEYYPKVISGAAESWTDSPDAKTYTFHLSPNIKFHDGSPLTSEDVKATYDRIRNPPPGVTSV